VWNQKRGFISDPIRVQNGYLILRVGEHFQKGLASYEEVEPEIQERMITPLMSTRVRAYLTKLREEAFLEIKPGYVDTGAAQGKDTQWKDVAQLKPQTVTKEEVQSHKKMKKFLFIPLPWTGGTTAPASPPKPAAAGAPPGAATQP
jgi:hypothetical protein